MAAEDNKALIRRLVDDFWNKRDVTVFDDVFATRFVDHTPQPGSEGTKEGFRQLALALQAAFPDGRSSLDDLLAEGDKVGWRWTFRGTHQGQLMGMPATGKSITLTGITIDRFAGGQIVERWSQADNLGLLQQLGAIPAPEQSSAS